MCVLIIVFPILSENRFRVENDMFVIVQLLFLIIFTTLFSIRNPLEEQTLIKELNFGSIKKIDYFYSKTISELGIFYPQIIFLLILFSGFTNTSINNSIIYIIFSSVKSSIDNMNDGYSISKISLMIRNNKYFFIR